MKLDLFVFNQRPLWRAGTLALAMFASACSHLPPPQGDGASMAERRRAMLEGPSGTRPEPPSKTTSEATEGGSAETLGSTADVAAGSLDETLSSSTSGRAMRDAKKLDAPDLGIQLPIGVPPLGPRSAGDNP